MLLQFHTRKNCLCRGGKTKFVSEGVEFDPTDPKSVKVALNLGYQNPCFCKGLMSECLRIAQGLFFLPCIRDTRGHHGPQGDRRVPLGKSCLCWSTLELFSLLFPGGLAVKILLKYSVSEEHFLCFFGDVLKVLPRYSEDLQSDRQLQSKLMQLESINKNRMDNMHGL